MAQPLYADRVRETTTTSGTGTVLLAGAVSSYEAFSAAFTTGAIVSYALVDTAASAWEVGIGTFTTGPNSLARTTVLASSNSNATINLSGGTTQVFNTVPAALLVTLNSSSILALAAAALTIPINVAFSTTPTFDCSKSNVFYLGTMTGNVTSQTFSNPSDGQTINVFYTQGTGGQTAAWPASFKWPNGVAGVLSTGAGAVDLLVATYRSSTGFWYAALQTAFA
jgi:hypothetical protein